MSDHSGLYWDPRARSKRGAWTVVLKRGNMARHILLGGTIHQDQPDQARAALKAILDKEASHVV